MTHDGGDVFMQQAGLQQFAHQVTHAACRIKVVHIGFAIGVNAGEQWHGGAEIGDVIPSEMNACGSGHGHQMHGVIGGTARGQQAHHAIHHGLFIIDFADRRVAIAQG